MVNGANERAHAASCDTQITQIFLSFGFAQVYQFAFDLRAPPRLLGETEDLAQPQPGALRRHQPVRAPLADPRQIRDRDCVLLCTNGLTDFVDDASLVEILDRRGSVEDRCVALGDKAVKRGALHANNGARKKARAARLRKGA